MQLADYKDEMGKLLFRLTFAQYDDATSETDMKSFSTIKQLNCIQRDRRSILKSAAATVQCFLGRFFSILLYLVIFILNNTNVDVWNYSEMQRRYTRIKALADTVKMRNPSWFILREADLHCNDPFSTQSIFTRCSNVIMKHVSLLQDAHG